MEISNDTLFMFAIILLFFCLMKDRPCNVEGLDSGSEPDSDSRYIRKLGRNPGKLILKDFYNLPQQPGIDYSKCGQEGAPCIPCVGEENFGIAAGKCREKDSEYAPEFDINSYNGGRNGKRWHFARAGVDTDMFNRCGKKGCGIICDSQYASTPPPGTFPRDQNGIFCSM